MVGLAIAGPSLCSAFACSSFSTAEAPPGLGDAAQASENADTSVPGSDARPGSISDGGTLDAACDSGSSRACRDRYVYVTRRTLPGNFAANAAAGVSPLDLADEFCREDANERQTSFPDLKGRVWRAWMCTGRDDANGRIANVDARWITPENVVVFPDLSALQATAPTAALSMATKVWTGCNTRGNGATGFDCASWTNDAVMGIIGLGTSTGQAWSDYARDSCTSSSPLYCFENGD